MDSFVVRLIFLCVIIWQIKASSNATRASSNATKSDFCKRNPTDIECRDPDSCFALADCDDNCHACSSFNKTLNTLLLISTALSVLVCCCYCFPSITEKIDEFVAKLFCTTCTEKRRDKATHICWATLIPMTAGIFWLTSTICVAFADNSCGAVEYECICN